MLTLANNIDVAAANAAFARDGHVRLQPFLAEAAAIACLAEMKRRSDWVQVINSGDKVFELSRETRAAMTATQRDGLEQAVLAGAQTGFQYRYEALRLPDGTAPPPAGDSLIAGWPAFLSGAEVRGLLQAITGAADIAFADGQATAYGPGDFLTGHDDAVSGKHRRAAYVFSLNPLWRVEWGGLLLFHADGNRVHGVAPDFNSLDIFAVPQMHSVSMVTGSVPNRRYSITGWLRANG
ncbi:2OG-Fe(II) oxygenase family protein [Sandarakinorhabdus sp. AAP62]|uniref:2OG-Fe(II) oxygenase n=1 Tax=Sandarakinorhabdus sp. AAP62 TaxID=1248916 RepID=UPI0002D3D866|nr:2OG-Fe(II) oxygenase family protein [Sandarakinorhabdus sp. AAP62]